MTQRWLGNELYETDKPARIRPAVLGALFCVAVALVLAGGQHGRHEPMRTPTQLVILDDYRSERRCGQAPIFAAQAIRDSYARVIARQQADGITPTRAVLDRFRVAEQWVTTVVQRDIVRLGRAS
jgi:hypothetical protein